jgi:probable non-F420 flavinoid oxidoreductase
MVTIGYHASHEQFAPSALLRYAKLAEDAGFVGGMCSDHLHPWSEDQGESGHAWTWLGAALQATTQGTYGVVTAPVQRYHPAVIAQACATLAEMFPGRFWVAVGSGEALNEHVTGEPWPREEVRDLRLKEAVDVIRALWAGELVNHRGLIRVEEAQLYTLPETLPLLIGAAVTKETAEWVAGWADGFVTVNRDPDVLGEVVERFRAGGGEGKPMYLQVHVSYAESEEEAYAGAYDQWRTVIFPSDVLASLDMPSQFDAAATFVRPEDLDRNIWISNDLDRHIEWLQKCIDLGFDVINVHNVNRDQERFIEAYGKHVLPALQE